MTKALKPLQAACLVLLAHLVALSSSCGPSVEGTRVERFERAQYSARYQLDVAFPGRDPWTAEVLWSKDGTCFNRMDVEVSVDGVLTRTSAIVTPDDNFICASTAGSTGQCFDADEAALVFFPQPKGLEFLASVGGDAVSTTIQGFDADCFGTGTTGTECFGQGGEFLYSDGGTAGGALLLASVSVDGGIFRGPAEDISSAAVVLEVREVTHEVDASVFDAPFRVSPLKFSED